MTIFNALLSIAILILHPSAQACVPPPATEKESLSDLYASHDNIVVAEAVKKFPDSRVELRIIHKFKGNWSGEKVVLGSNGMNCNFSFEEGGTYLVYSSGKSPTPDVTSFTGTTYIGRALDHLQWLTTKQGAETKLSLREAQSKSEAWQREQCWPATTPEDETCSNCRDAYGIDPKSPVCQKCIRDRDPETNASKTSTEKYYSCQVRVHGCDNIQNKKRRLACDKTTRNEFSKLLGLSWLYVR